MLVVYKRPGENPVIMDIHIDLETLQRMVEGYIEHVRLTDKVGLIINEEGKLHGMEPNFYLQKLNDMIVGPAVFVREGGEEFTDLSEEDIEMIMLHFTEILLERKREEIRKRNNRAVMIEVANGIVGWGCLIAICFMLSGIGG